MGTYAYVRKAIWKKTGKIVAIKTSRGSTSITMLKNEFNLLKRLDDDNIIKVFEYLENKSKGEAYLIMEYFKGITLDEYINENGVLSEEDSKMIITCILSSIQYIHDLGIAHRDIKPENVLINEKKIIKIIDFNISKSFLSQSFDSENRFRSVLFTQISSPLYCAPEIKEQWSYNESIDIWGAGTILFTMLFGSFISHSLNKFKCVTERSCSIREIINSQTNITEIWKQFILSLLSNSPDDRPTAEEALQLEWVRELNKDDFNY